MTVRPATQKRGMSDLPCQEPETEIERTTQQSGGEEQSLATTPIHSTEVSLAALSPGATVLKHTVGCSAVRVSSGPSPREEVEQIAPPEKWVALEVGASDQRSDHRREGLNHNTDVCAHNIR